MNAIEVLEKLAVNPNLCISSLSIEEFDAVEKEIQKTGKSNLMLTIVAPMNSELQN